MLEGMSLMHSWHVRVLAAVFCAAALLLLPAARSVMRLRAPAVAGQYYPAQPAALRDAVHRFFGEAGTVKPPGRLVGCIAPHAAYGFAGEIMAGAFKELQPGQFDRVIILAPSNFARFDGLSIPSVEGFITPLGIVELDTETIRTLSYSPLISTRALHSGARARRSGLHEEEYSIEVLLPFLQDRLGAFKLVPVLVGQLNWGDGRFNENALAAVAEQFRRIVDERTLIVASSNFTQYGESFGYVPFRENVFGQIENLDKVAFEYVLARDNRGFRNYVELSKNPIVGHLAIQLLIELLPEQTRGTLHGYATSGRKMNSADRSVSYAAICFYASAEAATPAPAPEAGTREERP